jgi:lipid-A-disaccharide synthase
MAGPLIFLSAGEASGESYGTSLIHAIRELAPEAKFFGLGGERMEAAGLHRIVRAEDVAVMGITEVVRHMPRIYGEYRKLKKSLQSQPHLPDAAVLIDFPDVNLGLARELHRLHIPVIFFVSPQLWAWKKHRIHQVKRYVDRMLVIFPFEEEFYKGHGVAATFVGHPLADLPQPPVSRKELAQRYALDSEKPWVALLPGSRGKEIELNLPTMLEVAAELNGEAEFLLPLAPTLTSDQRSRVSAMLHSQGIASRLLPRVAVVNDARSALVHARASVVASGTATVEAALIGNPFLVVYRISDLSYAVAKRVVKVPFVAMPNLIAGREVVPELIQGDFTAANVVLHLRRQMHIQNDRERMTEDLRQVAAALRFDDARGESGNRKTAIGRVAEITIDLISKSGRKRLKSTRELLSQAE